MRIPSAGHLCACALIRAANQTRERAGPTSWPLSCARAPESTVYSVCSVCSARPSVSIIIGSRNLCAQLERVGERADERLVTICLVVVVLDARGLFLARLAAGCCCRRGVAPLPFLCHRCRLSLSRRKRGGPARGAARAGLRASEQAGGRTHEHLQRTSKSAAVGRRRVRPPGWDCANSQTRRERRLPSRGAARVLRKARAWPTASQSRPSLTRLLAGGSVFVC